MNPKRALLSLLLVNIVIQTGSSLKERQLPRPSRFAAIALVFLILNAIGDTVPKAQRTMVMFGALVTLTVALRYVAGKPFGVKVGTDMGTTVADSEWRAKNPGPNKRQADKNRRRSTGSTGNTAETYANA